MSTTYNALKEQCVRHGISVGAMCKRAGVGKDLLNKWRTKEPKSFEIKHRLEVAIQELAAEQSSNASE